MSENVEKKKITGLKVVDPGSKPDVDTDFHTEGRAEVYNYIAEKYGETAVSNIATFGTFKAKKSFKDMATIYEKNFQAANKISSLIPDPQDGESMSITDMFDSKHDRYDEAADFRQRVEDDDWKPILEGAMALEGRVRETGVHACGVLMSSRSLEGVMPTMVRQDDGRVISQWEYGDCEAIGLVKMDFLGLDTIDLIDRTLQYIERSGKKAPDMEAVINGDMQDPKTLRMISQGKTIGVFQIGKNPGVRDLLRRARVDSIEDIIAITAMYRPGPMGMNSHTRYADRKNGLEDVDYIHSEFAGSALEDILGRTYGLCIYQEQVLQISNQIGGMTLQEGDKLRKAMGKKKMDVMDSMKPKFFSGGRDRGFSDDALEALWDTMVPFAKYAFNRSHSASYAITAYETAYLKANYPAEFMAAAIAGTLGNNNKKDLTHELMKETRRMGLKVGPVDSNHSDKKVAPALSGSKYDIVLGFSGIKAVSDSAAETIIRERDENGDYASPEDFIKRNMRNNITTKTIYESLALAGAFDSFGYTRASIVESIPTLLSQEKKSQSKGSNLFASMGVELESKAQMSKDQDTEFNFSDKLKREADICGIYISSHPMERAGEGVAHSGHTAVKDIIDEKKAESIPSFKGKRIRLVGAITDFETKVARSGKKRYMFTVDDGTGYVEVRATGDIAMSFSKDNIISSAESKREKENLPNTPLVEFVPDEKNKSLLRDNNITAIPEPNKNEVYIFDCSVIRRDGEVSVSLSDIKPLRLDKRGRLPLRVRLTADWLRDKKTLQTTLKSIASKYPGETELWIGDASRFSNDDLLSGEELDISYRDTKLRVDPSKHMLREMEQNFTIDLFDLGITPNHNIEP